MKPTVTSCALETITTIFCSLCLLSTVNVLLGLIVDMYPTQIGYLKRSKEGVS